MKRNLPNEQYNNQRKQPRFNFYDQQQRNDYGEGYSQKPQAFVQPQARRSNAGLVSSDIPSAGPNQQPVQYQFRNNSQNHQYNRWQKNYQYNNRNSNHNNNNNNNNASNYDNHQNSQLNKNKNKKKKYKNKNNANNNYNNNSFNRNRQDFQQRNSQQSTSDPVNLHIDNVIKRDSKFGAGQGFTDPSYSSFPPAPTPIPVDNPYYEPQPSTSKQPLPVQKGTSTAANRWQQNQIRAKVEAQAQAQSISQLKPSSPKAKSMSPKNPPKEEDQGPIVPGWHNLPRFDIKEVDDSAFQVPDTITDFYDRLGQVGEGTYGKVYKAKNKVSKLHVALKRIRMEQERDGFPVTALREIKLLQQSHHDNIVRLHEMLVTSGSVYMVFEYMENDLTGLLQHGPDLFQVQHKKSLCQQMLAGLSYLHYRGILHRDMKGSNILISNKGVLKLADFGLARFYHKHRKADYTNRVITIWYRPPELLLGATSYGPEVDMWSAGCIMLEIYTTKPVFQGDNEVHQLEMIFKMLGAPSHEDWPGFSNLPWYELVRPTGKHSSEKFNDTFKRWLTPAGIELAQALLTFNPEKRISAHDALQLPFFKSEEPRPALPDHLGDLQGEWHEFEAKREKAQAKYKHKEMESKHVKDAEIARGSSA